MTKRDKVKTGEKEQLLFWIGTVLSENGYISREEKRRLISLAAGGKNHG